MKKNVKVALGAFGLVGPGALVWYKYKSDKTMADNQTAPAPGPMTAMPAVQSFPSLPAPRPVAVTAKQLSPVQSFPSLTSLRTRG